MLGEQFFVGVSEFPHLDETLPERSGEGQSTRGWGTVDGCIETFEWTGQPDAAYETYQEHVA